MKLRIAIPVALCALLAIAPSALAVNSDNVASFDSPANGAYVNASPVLQFESDGDLAGGGYCKVQKSGAGVALYDGDCDSDQGPIVRGDIGDASLGQYYFAWDLSAMLAQPSGGDGVYTVQYTPDWANPPDNPGTSSSFTLDTIAPTVTVSAPEGVLADRTPEATFAVTDLNPGQSYCAVDPVDPLNASDYTACPSGDFDLSSVPDGSHKFYVRSVDLAGNVGFDHSNFTIDATPPSLSIGGLADGAQLTTSNPNFTVTVSDAGVGGAMATCSYDGQVALSCASTAILGASLPDGSHTLTVTATDALGNTVSQVIHFSISTAIPVELVPKVATFAKAKVKVKGAKVSFSATGAFAVPAGLTPVTACTGTATLVIGGKLKGKKTATWRKRAKLTAKGATCVTVPAKFSLPKAYKGKPLTAKLSFGGNGLVGGFDKNGKIKKL